MLFGALIFAAGAWGFSRPEMLLAIVSGVITPLFAGERLRRLRDRWTSRPPGLIRAWGLVALALGGALVFAGT